MFKNKMVYVFFFISLLAWNWKAPHPSEEGIIWSKLHIILESGLIIIKWKHHLVHKHPISQTPTPLVLDSKWEIWLIFTPSFVRYDLTDSKSGASPDHVLEVWCYEAYRLFRDRLVGSAALNNFDNILASVVRNDWSVNVFTEIQDSFYVTWGARAELQTAPGAPLPPHGKSMGKLNKDDLKTVIEKGLVQYGREFRELDILIFKEVFHTDS